MRPTLSKVSVYLLILVIGIISPACTPQAYFNNTSSLGGDTPGSRGTVTLAFINNTPYRAIFTYGIYDDQDQNTVPRFAQFAIDPDPMKRLEGNTSSPQFTFVCGRQVAIGTQRFIESIKKNKMDTGSSINQEALNFGVGFSDKPLSDPDADKANMGRIDGTSILQGYEFQCESLVIVRLETVTLSPFKATIEWDIVLP